MPRQTSFSTSSCIAGTKVDSSPTPLSGSAWYIAQNIGDGMGYSFAPGALAGFEWLSADFLLDGEHLAVFVLEFQEGETGPTFGLSFGLLNQCQARLRLPLDMVNLNQWMYPREGAFLKPRTQGQRVDLKKVDRMRLLVTHKSHKPVRWCMTSIQVGVVEPPRLTDPLLTCRHLLDEFGQSGLHAWPGRTTSRADLDARLKSQLEAAPQQRWPEHFSRWGGWKDRRVAATGWFHTHHDGKRWWLVDPEGCLFWSAGPDCVTVDTTAAYQGLEKGLAWLPEREGPFAAAYQGHTYEHDSTVNYLAANFIHTFGEDWYACWTEIAMAELRRVGFNSVANWSDWESASRVGMPYVRDLEYAYLKLPLVYRDFPDVFHPDFEAVATQFATALEPSKDDPAFIGYFLMNEPTWGFASDCPAEGMLFNTPDCHSRRALADFLKERHSTDAALSAAWGMNVTFSDVAGGEWRQFLTAAARADLEDFSEIMVERFFGGLSKACRAVDPHHMNLGIRYYTIPPRWALKGMRTFDVFSMNCYKSRLPAVEMARVSKLMRQPIMIGEWHFGALDAGLPASGIGHVPTQADRGRAYRFYLEDAASQPWCIGVHYFTLYDQSAIGRFDGENYNIGFLDICNNPYPDLAAAARLSHERMYPVADGSTPPFDDPPQYLPLLFM
jgi:hypothetical protein